MSELSLAILRAKEGFGKINVNPKTDCWEWRGCKTRVGYGVLSIDSKLFYVHRISFRIFHGVIRGKNMVMHSCDNPKCFNPAHLSQGTAKDNVEDMWKKGRAKTNTSLFSSPNNPRLKFTKNELEKMARERIGGARSVDVCKKYNISKTHLRDAVKKWSDA